MINNTIIMDKLKDIKDIDFEKSYDIYYKNKYELIIYLNKRESYCDYCGSINLYVRGSRKSNIKYACEGISADISIKLTKRVYYCPDCNHYTTEHSPFITKQRTISINLDMKILNLLKDKCISYKKAAETCDVSTTYVQNTFDSYVNIRRGKMPQVLCIDEIYNKKLTKTHYCCTLYAPQWREIIDILPSRHKYNLIDYFAKIPYEEKKKVKFISIDLWEGYRSVAKLCFPDALVCADSFHVIKNLMYCFDKIRISIMNKYKSLKSEGHNYYWVFKKYTFILRKDISKIKDTIYFKKSKMYVSKYQILDNILSLDSTLKLAYELKEEYRNFNSTATINNAAEWLDELIIKFKKSKIKEYEVFWSLLQKWRTEIINSFNRINGHRISNGAIERLNNDINTIYKISFGLTNFERTRNRIMYCLNDNAPIKGK